MWEEKFRFVTKIEKNLELKMYFELEWGCVIRH